MFLAVSSIALFLSEQLVFFPQYLHMFHFSKVFPFSVTVVKQPVTLVRQIMHRAVISSPPFEIFTSFLEILAFAIKLLLYFTSGQFTFLLLAIPSHFILLFWGKGSSVLTYSPPLQATLVAVDLDFMPVLPFIILPPILQLSLEHSQDISHCFCQICRLCNRPSFWLAV